MHGRYGWRIYRSEGPRARRRAGHCGIQRAVSAERLSPGVLPAGFWQWVIDGSFTDGFFESAKLLLSGVVNGRLNQGIEGLAPVFLSRHYLELALKYVLLHSRWLIDEKRNATGEAQPVPNTHNLEKLWTVITSEVEAKSSVVPKGLDLAFVGAFIGEFNVYDPKNWRFRYPSQQIPPAPSSAYESLGIDFAALLSDLQKVFDVLSTLDGYLIETPRRERRMGRYPGQLVKMGWTSIAVSNAGERRPGFSVRS